MGISIKSKLSASLVSGPSHNSSRRSKDGRRNPLTSASRFPTIDEDEFRRILTEKD